MKPSLTSSTLILSSLLHTTSASPVRIPDLIKRRPATYSVVPVDGGTSTVAATAPPTTQTVTNQITRTTTLLETTLLTSVVTESETPSTTVITITTATPTTIVETVTSDITIYPSPATVTATPPTTFQTLTVTDTSVTSVLPSTTPYDNGMWHTTYYYTVSSAASTSSVDPPAPTSTAPSTTPTPAVNAAATTADPIFSPTTTVSLTDVVNPTTYIQAGTSTSVSPIVTSPAAFAAAGSDDPGQWAEWNKASYTSGVWNWESSS